MHRILRSNIIDITGILIIAFALLLLSFSSKFNIALDFSPSILNLNTIFLSILIEALPFVLIGVLIAGVIQIFVTEEHIQRWIPDGIRRRPLLPRTDDLESQPDPVSAQRGSRLTRRNRSCRHRWLSFQ